MLFSFSMSGETGCGTVTTPDPCHGSVTKLSLDLRSGAPFYPAVSPVVCSGTGADVNFAERRYLAHLLALFGAVR